jgi:putative transposase
MCSLAEDEEHTLMFYQFPQTMHRYIKTTNAIESLFSNVRQRTHQWETTPFFLAMNRFARCGWGI